MRELPNVQWWLAELDQYGNPELIDGAHSSRAGCNQAAYLIQNLACITRKDRKFAVARVEFTACAPSDKGVDKKAIAILNRGLKQINGVPHV